MTSISNEYESVGDAGGKMYGMIDAVEDWRTGKGARDA
jgi:hypothetical protein